MTSARRILVSLVALGIALAVACRAQAQDLVSGISTDLIQITSNFTGTDIVVFGAIATSGVFDMPGDRDLVIVVRGPPEQMTVRRKERVAGIWINSKQLVLSGMPGYYFLASTRPLQQITGERALQRFELGTENFAATVSPTGTDPTQAAAFKSAAIRNAKEAGLYFESANGIDFLSRSLFRARIPVPAAVPPGQYLAEVYLFRNGSVVSAQSTPLYIDKSGMERRLYNFAHDQPFLYGMAAILMAMTIGWLSDVALRRHT
jgi:uncharacterized protein (TIGR02186 family)